MAAASLIKERKKLRYKYLTALSVLKYHTKWCREENTQSPQVKAHQHVSCNRIDSIKDWKNSEQF